jgi:phosphonate degradation associated HDIG domain protein
MDAIDRIEALFDAHGEARFDGRRREDVTALEHALQCAQLAEWAHADDALVAAALLHDLGHLVDAERRLGDGDNLHEMRALPLLSEAFGATVIEPIRLHVQAKRYLVATDGRYLATLSAASVHALHLQGGPMSRDEVLLFESRPYAEDAVMLRRWDDLARRPRKRTPPLAHYLALLRDLGRRSRALRVRHAALLAAA